jgi:predicted nucleic acid-binding protein
MIDMIIAEPHISQGQLAVRFGYTQAWVSTIMSSDAWKARLANRREEIVDPALTMTLEEKFRGLTERSLEVLAQKLAQPIQQIPDNLALRAAELGAKALGVGGNAPPAPPPPADYLLGLADRLVALRSTVYNAPSKTIEGDCNVLKAS